MRTENARPGIELLDREGFGWICSSGILAFIAAAAHASADPVPTADGGLSGSLTVFAAASLTETFTELGARLMADNPDLTVTFSFAGSSALASLSRQFVPQAEFSRRRRANKHGIVPSQARQRLGQFLQPPVIRKPPVIDRWVRPKVHFKGIGSRGGCRLDRTVPTCHE